MNVFITGQAGMIGFHTAQYLSSLGHQVTGIDNFASNHDAVALLKQARATQLLEQGITTHTHDILSEDYDELLKDVDVVIHLAAWSNPRHSTQYPALYINNNILGTQYVIDSVKRAGIKKVIYASSSSVMNGQALPFKESDPTLHQTNPYSWSKYVNECQFQHSDIEQTVGLRFFTVYGPYGRPDMAVFNFTNSIINDQPIDLYNQGNMQRDFTYVDDIVQGIGIVVDQTQPGHEIYNIGSGTQVNLLDFVHEIERCTGKTAITNLLPMHPADAPATWADISKIQQLGYCPTTNIASGIEKFVTWYRDYYRV